MIGTVFTALAIMDTLAILLAGPVNAAMLKWSMRLDSIGKGMPFWLAFFLCGLTMVALAQVRIKDATSENGVADEEQRLLSDGEGDHERGSLRQH